MLVAFILTMPGKGSWNGKWTGEGNLYARVVRMGKNDSPEINRLIGKSESYSWSDGWRASVEIKQVDAKEAARIRKNTKGFCGYDWMIDSLISYGEILSSNDIRDRKAKEREEIQGN